MSRNGHRPGCFGSGVSETVLTFTEFVTESAVKTAAAIGIGAKIFNLSRQVAQDRKATDAEKTIADQIRWLSALVAVGIAAPDRTK